MESTRALEQLTVSPRMVNTRACELYNLYFRVVTVGFITLLGLIGNAMSLIIMKKEKNKTSTILALMYLAASDFIVVAIYGVFNWSSPLASLAGNEKLSLLIKIHIAAHVIPLGQIFNFISVSITVIVIWQRYVSVCIPLKAKTYVSTRKVHIQVLSVSIFAILFHIPTLCTYEIKHLHLTPRRFAKNASFTIFYELVLTYTLTYFMPITALLVMALGLIRTLKTLKFHNQDSQNRAAAAKHEMTMSLVVIIVVFVVCQSFAPIRRLLMFVYDPYSQAQMCGNDLFYFAPFEVVSVLFNSSANFFIFVLCARGYRKKVFLFCKRSNRVTHVANALSYHLDANID